MSQGLACGCIIVETLWDEEWPRVTSGAHVFVFHLRVCASRLRLHLPIALVTCVVDWPYPHAARPRIVDLDYFSSICAYSPSMLNRASSFPYASSLIPSATGTRFLQIWMRRRILMRHVSCCPRGLRKTQGLANDVATSSTTSPRFLLCLRSPCCCASPSRMRCCSLLHAAGKTSALVAACASPSRIRCCSLLHVAKEKRQRSYSAQPTSYVIIIFFPADVYLYISRCT